jgi:hypothetical protein
MNKELAIKLLKQHLPSLKISQYTQRYFEHYLETEDHIWVDKLVRQIGETQATTALAVLTAMMRKDANVVIFTTNDMRHDDNRLFDLLNKSVYTEAAISRSQRKVKLKFSGSTISFVNFNTVDMVSRFAGIKNLYIFAPSKIFGPAFLTNGAWDSMPLPLQRLLPASRRWVVVADKPNGDIPCGPPEKHFLAQKGFKHLTLSSNEWFVKQDAHYKQ